MMLGVKVRAYLNLGYPLIRRLSCISELLSQHILGSQTPSSVSLYR